MERKYHQQKRLNRNKTMKYTYHVVEDENKNKLYCILENASQQVVDAYLFKDEADNRYDFLCNGGAFDGFTPEFMLKSTKGLSNLNKEFESYIKN